MRPGNYITYLVAAFVLTGFAGAQTNPNLEVGFKPYGAYDAFKLDTVNLMNRNLTVVIPLASNPQRGSLAANTRIQYNNKIWRVRETCDYGNCTSRWDPSPRTPGGPGMSLVTDVGIPGSPPSLDSMGAYIFSDADWSGNTHIMVRGNSDPLHSGYTLFYSMDGSGYMLSTDCLSSKFLCHGDPSYLFKNNGDGQFNPQALMEDSNGNKMTVQGYGPAVTDTVGRTLFSTAGTDTSGCSGPRTVTSAGITLVPGPNGSNFQIKECDVTLPLNTNFQAQDENLNPIAEFHGQMGVAQSYIVYDGNSWSTSPQWIFHYDDNSDGTNYGDLTQVVLPTLGTLSYTWDTVSWFDGLCGTQPAPGHTPASRGVKARILDANDGKGPQIWNYEASTAFDRNPFSGAQLVGVSDPTGNEVVHTFWPQGSGGCYPYEVYTQYYQGMQSAGNLLKAVRTDYHYTNTTLTDPDGYPIVAAILPWVITTTLANGKVSQIQRDYVESDGVTGAVQVHDYILSNYYWMPVGNLVEQREYDYGAPGPLLKKTHYTYEAWPSGGNAYFNRNMLDRVASVTIYNGGGTQVASTTYGYDQYGLQPSGISPAYLDGSVGSYRGNPTSVSNWVSSAQGNLTSTTTYYDSGMPYQTTDANGNVTTLSYSSNYVGAYVTQTNMPATGSVQHIVSGQYDFNTGRLTSFTDQNGQTSTYHIDQLGRMTSASFPDTGSATFSYPDFVTVHRTRLIDSRSTDEYVRFDGIGRLTRKATLEQSGTYDQADTCYNGDSTVNFKSYAYQGSGLGTAQVCSGDGDTYSYDGLQRVLTVTHSDGTKIQNQYTNSSGLNTAAVLTIDEGNGSTQVSRVSQSDALGRLVSMCEISSSTQLGLGATPAACSQDIAQNGFLTSYGYDALGNLTSVNQGGYLARSFIYDGLSRLTSATNPESGTTSYKYDSDSACGGTYRGDLASKTDARSIRTCYRYDALHRQTFKSYSDGTTPSATFNYDESTVAGQSTLHPIGRLTSKTTSNTGAYFWNIDSMGRPKGMSQCTPRTCTSSYYNTTYTYDLLGDLTNATLPGNISLTYTYNQAPHLGSITSSLNDGAHPASMLSNVSYGPFGIVSEQLGNNAMEQMTYTPRGWLSSIAAVGLSSTPSSGTITVSGTEQSRIQNNATPGQGSVTISGSERSTQVQTQPATHSNGTVTFSGSEQRVQQPDCPPQQLCYLYDYGTCTITVAGMPASVNYGQGSTTYSIALQVVVWINSHAPINTYVSATQNGNQVQLTSVATGASTNYSLSAACTYDGGDFSHPSFTPAAVGMSGGQNAQYTTSYDTGTLSIVVNGYRKSVSYGQTSTSSSLASSLAAAFANDGSSPVTATSSGATVNLTSRLSGSSTNYSLSTSSNTTNGYFTLTSFPTTPSGSTLTGGTDATLQYDTGTVTVTVNGTPSIATYGQGSTNATVASAVAAAIDANSPWVSATSSGNLVNLTSKTNGANTNYSLLVATVSTDGFTPSSFSGSSPGMSGGTGGALYSVGLTYYNNGDVSTSTDSVNGNWAYTYDEFNRAKTGVASNLGVGCGWAYDRFGNRWQQNAYNGTCLTPSYTFSGGTNRIDGASYDAAGNLTRDPNTGMSYAYDAENRLITAGSYSYVYDAEGRRVAKKTSGSITNEYPLDASGAQLIELNGAGNVLHTNLFANGNLFATYGSDNQTYFHFSDWLGNRRYEMRADGTGTLTCTNYPFGDALSCSGTGPDATEHHFTGKERDSESGLDMFGARYYGSSLGRFETADPLPWLSWQRGNSKDRDRFTAFLGNPQSLNLYAYVLNNPLNKTDPTGMYQCGGTAEQCAAVKKGLDDIKAAAANLKVGTSGRTALDKVLSFYGAENTNNGVNINFNNHDPNALGSTSTANGVTTISFGANALTPLGPTGKGETVAHEGTHGVDQKTSGHMPHTFWQFYDTEYHAYQAESAVDKGVGSANETDEHPVWFPGITPQQRTTNITQDAYSNACFDVGGC